MKTVFLISGKARSGKNQFALYLADVYKQKKNETCEDSFAKELKRRCIEDIGEIVKDYNAVFEEALALLKKDTVTFSRGPLGKKAMDLLRNNIISEEDWVSDVKKPIVRKAFQVYGTDIYRNRINDEYWVDFTINACEKSEKDTIFITDVRYENEINAFQNNENFNCISIRMERDPDNKSEKDTSHTSETSLDEYQQWTYVVENNDSLDCLHESAIAIYEDMRVEAVEFTCD